MEDASSVDLDWFWRGWFYGTEACDIAVENVKLYKTPANTHITVGVKDAPIEVVDFSMYQGVAGMLGEASTKYLSPDTYIYSLELKNAGGLVMPVIIQLNYKDGSSEITKLPAEIWRYNPEKVNKVLTLKKEAISFVIDPNLETADIDTSNNAFPRKEGNASKFQEFKKQSGQ